MDEGSALDVTAVRVAESDERLRTAWSDADRAWASRAAAEVVGEHGGAEAFLARRAALALERLERVDARYVKAARGLRWRGGVGTAVIAVAFVAGVAVDRVGGEQSINLLAPPYLLLLAWNLAVYVALALGPLLAQRGAASMGALRRGVARLCTGAAGAGFGAHGARATRVERLGALALAWSQLAARLYAARAARILHFAAAVFAVGVIAGLYVRGLAFEYRASWQSTFLDAPQVRALLAAALAPGAAVTLIPVPDVAHVAAIRAPAGENAAPWLHLIAATLGVIVVLPRLLLGFVALALERRRAARLPVPLSEPYYARLLRGYRGNPERLRVTPYSHAPSPAALAGLEAVLARAFGATAAIVVEAPVDYGADVAPGPATAPAAAASERRIVLFNATATPEPDVHGAYAASLASRAGAPPVALVDEAALRARSPGDDARLEARRDAWRDVLALPGVVVAFVDLAAPDLAAAERALDAAQGEAR